MVITMKAKQFLDDMVNNGTYTGCAKEAHETWRATKASQGWTYAATRDNAAKKNPLMLPFEELPADIQGQNSLTPYAVTNFFRVNYSDADMPEFEGTIDAVVAGRDDALLQKVGEYVHSHFLGAMLSKGATVKTRDDMITYDKLTPDQKSWDLESAKSAMKYMLKLAADYKVA
jgi:hypothetical protein